MLQIKYLILLLFTVKLSFIPNFVYASALNNDAPGDTTGFSFDHGAIVCGDKRVKSLAIVFTGDEFGDGSLFIARTLRRYHVHASFFLTGNFYRNHDFYPAIDSLQRDGNYLGTHSDKHLLYCDWTKRDSLLVTEDQFRKDIDDAYNELLKFGITKKNAPWFMPPYEWYNDTVALWCKKAGLKLICFSPGTRSNADYTYPEMETRYVNTDSVMRSIIGFENQSASGLNGFILLLHIGTDPRRKDKSYFQLPSLIEHLQTNGYTLVTIDKLLGQDETKK